MMKITEETQDVVTIEVSGKLTKSDYESIIPSLKQKLSDQSSLSALIDVKSFDGIEFKAFTEDISFGWDNKDKFDKIAVVGDGHIKKVASWIGEALTRGEVKQFDRSESASARQWLTN